MSKGRVQEWVKRMEGGWLESNGTHSAVDCALTDTKMIQSLSWLRTFIVCLIEKV
jgi:hypothetical protein